MAIGGINGTSLAAAYTATSRRTEDALLGKSVAGPIKEAGDTADISAEALKKALEHQAGKVFGSAPASFAEMQKELAEKQKAFDQLMQEAKEVSGYDTPVTQTAAFTMYRVGPYAAYAQETGTWQWYNEDGTARDGRPPQDEFDAQMRVSEKKMKAHLKYLNENNHFEKFAEIARDATLLQYAGTNDTFKDEYLSNSSEAVRKRAGELLDSYYAYTYDSASRSFAHR